MNLSMMSLLKRTLIIHVSSLLCLVPAMAHDLQPPYVKQSQTHRVGLRMPVSGPVAYRHAIEHSSIEFATRTTRRRGNPGYQLTSALTIDSQVIGGLAELATANLWDQGVVSACGSLATGLESILQDHAEIQSMQSVGNDLKPVQKIVEDYAPYDLSIRDWQFGRFRVEQYRRLAAHTEQANESVNETRRPIVTIIDQFTCQLTRQSLSNASAWIGALNDRLPNMGSSAALGQAMARLSLKSQRRLSTALDNGDNFTLPYFQSPNYIAYESPDGLQFVFTLEQARQWNLIREASPAGPQPAHWLSERLSQSLGTTASNLESQLRRFARSVAENAETVTRWWANITASQVAARASSAKR